MKQISGAAARAVLCDPDFVVPPVPPGASGVAWLRASVGRFSTGEAHERRRAWYLAVLADIPPETLRDGHPIAMLARAMGLDDPESIVDIVGELAQAYRPGTGDDARADAAVDRLVALLGGRFDEPTAARISVLAQACDATATLVARARTRDVDEVLREDPPVPETRRRALVTTTVGGESIEAGEVVRIALAGDLAFGAGAHECPGREHALAMVRAAVS